MECLFQVLTNNILKLFDARVEYFLIRYLKWHFEKRKQEQHIDRQIEETG